MCVYIYIYIIYIYIYIYVYIYIIKKLYLFVQMLFFILPLKYSQKENTKISADTVLQEMNLGDETLNTE